MFKEMRRKEKAMSDEKVLEVLNKGSFGFLSTVGENGYAYGVPLNYTYFNNAIYFHSAKDGCKLDNISYNNKVSFCIVGNSKLAAEKFSYSYESVIAFGKAVKIEGEEKIEALMALIKKYSGDFIEKGTKYVKNDASKTTVIKIEIEHITGKTNIE